MPGDAGKPRILQRDVIIVVEIVNPDDIIAALKQALDTMHADEAGATCNQNFHLWAFCYRLWGLMNGLDLATRFSTMPIGNDRYITSNLYRHQIFGDKNSPVIFLRQLLQNFVY